MVRAQRKQETKVKMGEEQREERRRKMAGLTEGRRAHPLGRCCDGVKQQYALYQGVIYTYGGVCDRIIVLSPDPQRVCLLSQWVWGRPDSLLCIY